MAANGVTYELWEMRSGNLMGSYASEHEALQVLKEAIERYGQDYADSIELTQENGDTSPAVASGQALVGLALKKLALWT